MIFFGQENGISDTFGFSHYEINFGKYIPHFKVFNDLGPILGQPELWPATALSSLRRDGPGAAIQQALRSSNRLLLESDRRQHPSADIFSVAKYETANASPALNDVVFGFMNLDRNNDQQGNFDVNITQSGSNLFGIKSERTYDVKNIAAYTGQDPNRRNVFLNRKTGAQLLTDGLFVGVKKVPSTDGAWSTAPFEAQYLKVYDVTVPTAPGAPVSINPYAYTLVGSTTLSWAPPATDPDGLQWTYKITFNFNNQNFVVYTTSTSYTFMVNAGLLSVSVQAINPNEDLNANPPSSPASPTSFIKVLNAADDEDGDGQNNGNENFAGTNPLDPTSVLRITDISFPTIGQIKLIWTSVPGETYRIQGASSPGGTYMFLGGQFPASAGSTTEATVPITGLEFFKVTVLP